MNIIYMHTHDTGDIRQDYIMPPHVMYDVKTNREDMAGVSCLRESV